MQDNRSKARTVNDGQTSSESSNDFRCFTNFKSEG